MLALSVFLIAGAVVAQNIGVGNNGIVEKIAGQGFFKTDASVANETFLETVIGQIIAIFLGFLGILFLCFIIYSGIQWMTSGGEEEKITQAKTRIKNATIGLALIFFSFIIANTVYTFFYNQTQTPAAPQQHCAGDNDCPQGQICLNTGLCAPAEGHNCRRNNDCPPNQPVCASFGDVYWCTCSSDNDCSNLHDTPYCYERNLRTNICAECLTDEQCQQKLGRLNVCAYGTGQCQAAECLDDSDCVGKGEKTHCFSLIHTCDKPNE